MSKQSPHPDAVVAENSFKETLWRMFQGRGLGQDERQVMSRSLKVLNDKVSVEQIVEASRRLAFIDGELIVQDGQTGTELFILLDGKVDVVRDGEVVDHMRRGEFFGEIALLDGAQRTASVRAKGRVVALRVPAEAVDESMRERLWYYAAERRFRNHPEELMPMPDPQDREIWFEMGRHSVLEADEYEVAAPWVYLYHGEIQLPDGSRVESPSLMRGSAFSVPEMSRMVLLPEPEGQLAP